MTFEQANSLSFNPFDATKIWPLKDYPLIDVGTVTLNKNPENFFQDVEQAAFDPARMVPGLRPSPDKLLQGMFFLLIILNFTKLHLKTCLEKYVLEKVETCFEKKHVGKHVLKNCLTNLKKLNLFRITFKINKFLQLVCFK